MATWSRARPGRVGLGQASQSIFSGHGEESGRHLLDSVAVVEEDAAHERIACGAFKALHTYESSVWYFSCRTPDRSIRNRIPADSE